MMRLFIDPGHGGHDPGTVSPDGVRESDAALATGLTLKWLTARRGMPVLLSRSTDVYPGLTTRTRAAAEWGADVFVSVHYDSPGGRSLLYYSAAADRRNDSERLARRMAVILGVPAVPSVQSRFGRLYIDDARMPALVWEVDPITAYEDDRGYRLWRTTALLTALVAARTEAT